MADTLHPLEILAVSTKIRPTYLRASDQAHLCATTSETADCHPSCHESQVLSRPIVP
jgi:hypothetical protein